MWFPDIVITFIALRVRYKTWFYPPQVISILYLALTTIVSLFVMSDVDAYVGKYILSYCTIVSNCQLMVTRETALFVLTHFLLVIKGAILGHGNWMQYRQYSTINWNFVIIGRSNRFCGYRLLWDHPSSCNEEFLCWRICQLKGELLGRWSVSWTGTDRQITP